MDFEQKVDVALDNMGLADKLLAVIGLLTPALGGNAGGFRKIDEETIEAWAETDGDPGDDEYTLTFRVLSLSPLTIEMVSGAKGERQYSDLKHFINGVSDMLYQL